MKKKTRVIALLVAAATLAGCFRSPAERERRFLETGRKYFEKKDYARAILEFRNAAQLMPRDAEPYYQLGEACLASGDAGNALSNFRKAAELNPGHAAAQLKVAEAMSATQDKDLLEDAQKRLEGVLRHSPGNVNALDLLALTEWKLGRKEQAEKRYLEVLTKAPDDLRAAVGLAQIRLVQRDVKGAEAILKSAAARTPSAVAPLSVLGEFYLLTGKPEDAEKQFQQVLELDPRNGPALQEVAALEMRAGHTDQAGRMYKTLSSLPDKATRPLYAMFLFQTGKREQAIAELEKLAGEDRADRGIRNRLVFVYLGAGRASDAEKLLGDALRSDPKDVDALLQRSQISLAHGKVTEARNDLMQVLRFLPDSAVTHYLLARVYSIRKQESGERQELNEALRLDPNLLIARIDLARLLLRTNAAEAALEVMNAAPQKQKRDLAFIVQRNWALRATGDRVQMRAGVDEGLAVARTPDLLLQDAALKLDQNNYAGARVSLDEVLRSNPEDLRALDMLARTWLAQKEPATAVQKIREFVNRRPGSPALQILLGRLLLADGDKARARAAFEAARASDPGDAGAGLALAELDISTGQLQEARARLAAILARDPANFGALLTMGIVEERAGDRAAALPYYRKAVDVEPDNVTALNNLAYTLADFANRPDEALKYAEHALELAPDDAAVEDTLGWVLYKKQLFASAVLHLRDSVAREPTARRKLHLALTYLKMGDTALARKTLQAAINMDPSLPEAESARQLLNR